MGGSHQKGRYQATGRLTVKMTNPLHVARLNSIAEQVCFNSTYLKRDRTKGSYSLLISILALLWVLVWIPIVKAAETTKTPHYPNRPIHMVVPYSAGGGTDILARLLAAGLQKKLGVAVIIDNHPGAATAIGSEQVARAAPDGYTLLVTTGTLSVLPALYPKLNFKPAEDFQAISLFATAPNIFLVHPSVPANTLQEFLNYARLSQTPLHYGSSGNGGIGHLSMELLKQIAQIDMTHVPYKSGAPAMNALLAGEIPAMINNMAAAVQQVKTGRVKALAITTTERSSALPDVPTMSEAGIKDFDASAWFGMLAPAKTPQTIVETLAAAVNEIMASSNIEQTLIAQGVILNQSTPQAFDQIVKNDVIRWSALLKQADIKAD
jgi:tripartite-type tricarboxylate transporter receptor subunit TctC